jgi:uncharacterized membrane protein
MNLRKQPKTQTKTSRLQWRPVFLGLVGAVLFFWMSLLPSLLPRPWWLQGVISGIAMAVGYGLGVGSSALLRWFIGRDPSPAFKRQVWQFSKILLPAATAGFVLLGLAWQNEVRHILDVEPISATYALTAALVTIIVFWLLLAVSRAVRTNTRKLRHMLQRKLPPRVGAAIALVVSVVFVYWLLSGLLATNMYRIANNAFGARDNTIPVGVYQPTSDLKSGSPASLIPWEKIGFQGRGFVGTGPDASAIESYTKQPAKEPIRVYAGLASADSAQARAQLALAELKRTKAFDRDVLVLATATGTGWLDPDVMDAVEYLHGGDTAIVSQQYSYLPSWISFLVDQENAREAGRALYDTVIEAWAAEPEATRPKLIVYGLSLGSFGGQAAFSGVNDMRRSVDGVLFVGSPNDSETWRQITDRRDAGTPEWQPTYAGGTAVRFASTKEDIVQDPEQWNDKTRILFQQHGSDPVVWFSFDLLFHKPDWLAEQRAPDVSPATRWYPIVTFLHVGLDQAIAASAPIGRGHYYMDTAVHAWAAVVPPVGWSVQDSDKLQHYLDQQNSYPSY